MRRILPVLAALTLLAACSSDSDSTSVDDPTSTTTAAGAGATSSTATGGTDTAAVPKPVAEGFRSSLYADDAKWLCRPGKSPNFCDTDLDATVVAADGTLTPESFTPATDPPVDCFYLYPTTSEDSTPLADWEPGAEINNVQSLAARFAGTCRMYAPLYRQVTVAGLFGGGMQRDPKLWERAYADVTEAWKHYVANDNDGRGVILLGHSQGAGHIARLLGDEIEEDPAQLALLVSAMPIGSSVRVPEGEIVGGALDRVPMCTETDEVGCVVAYSAFRATAPPPANSLFGRPREGDGEVGCVNPVDPGAGDEPRPLTPYFRNSGNALTDPTAAASVATPWVTYPELLTARCVRKDGFHYLEITVNGDPADPRTDNIGGDLTPEWGLHSVDINLAQGDLVALAGRQADAWLAGRD